MILLEVENRGVEEALKAHFELAKAKGRFDVVNANICDFDGCSYKLEQCQGNNDTLRLSLSIGFFDELKEHGAVEKLRKVYGSYLVSDGSDGKEITLEFNAGSLPDDHEELANRAARLRRNCFAAVFEKYFEAQASGSQVKRAVIHYRPDETMYVEAKFDRVTVIFSTIFRDRDDINIGSVFLQEFREGRRGLAAAPQVLFSTKTPPQELAGTDARSGENVGYVTFVLLPRHFNPKIPQTGEKTIDLIHTFRNYLHYHIKCSKAYINSRMRRKTDDFLKVLNRARPDAQNKKGATAR